MNGAPADMGFDQLVIAAAMDLMECGWKLQAIAGVLQREPAWLEREIGKEIVANERGALN